MVRVKVDSHVHLLLKKKQKNPDWEVVRQVIGAAKINELDAICVTEHIEADAYDALMHGLFLENKLEANFHDDGTLICQGVGVFPGAELELANRMNVGVHTDLYVLMSLNRRPGFYTLETLHDALVKRGRPFKLVAHHIFWPGKTCDDLNALKRCLNAIEVPAKDLANVQKYLELARLLRLQTTGGSDAHTFIQVGACHTVFQLQDHEEYCTAKLNRPGFRGGLNS
ncbi:hypothetical protein NJF44_08675 [Pseudomonas guariconensis]|uniref:PHP-associated domain-containing protein n=1 Tax=Pseudomonas TaxID=286 RepID=UPI0020975E39|nr:MULTISPECIES: PHP-associated domain-containing protein [Pseudomonas]MCO7643110.1 hypothetical protein [Pseudomonas sp. S 311-6]MCO7514843.1 hypothetical protein [Pseudomonas putida]MCO7565848.1 hypothetical protein [Pseudomonas mosselii]MCO7605306.1 hypothetical protein [Pseudomonas guariconensis]MCO7616854.1 hypothetical protein [Pseudomonas guariconensis]